MKKSPLREGHPDQSTLHPARAPEAAYRTPPRSTFLRLSVEKHEHVVSPTAAPRRAATPTARRIRQPHGDSNPMTRRKRRPHGDSSPSATAALSLFSPSLTRSTCHLAHRVQHVEDRGPPRITSQDSRCLTSSTATPRRGCPSRSCPHRHGSLVPLTRCTEPNLTTLLQSRPPPWLLF